MKTNKTPQLENYPNGKYIIKMKNCVFNMSSFSKFTEKDPYLSLSLKTYSS